MGKGRIISEALQKGARATRVSLLTYFFTPSLSVVYLPGSYPLNTRAQTHTNKSCSQWPRNTTYLPMRSVSEWYLNPGSYSCAIIYSVPRVVSTHSSPARAWPPVIRNAFLNNTCHATCDSIYLALWANRDRDHT